MAISLVHLMMCGGSLGSVASSTTNTTLSYESKWGTVSRCQKLPNCRYRVKSGVTGYEGCSIAVSVLVIPREAKTSTNTEFQLYLHEASHLVKFKMCAILNKTAVLSTFICHVYLSPPVLTWLYGASYNRIPNLFQWGYRDIV